MKTKLKAAMFATLWTLVVALAAGIATNWKESPATGVEILLWGGLYAAGFFVAGTVMQRRRYTVSNG